MIISWHLNFYGNNPTSKLFAILFIGAVPGKISIESYLSWHPLGAQQCNVVPTTQAPREIVHLLCTFVNGETINLMTQLDGYIFFTRATHISFYSNKFRTTFLISDKAKILFWFGTWIKNDRKINEVFEWKMQLKN